MALSLKAKAKAKTILVPISLVKKVYNVSDNTVNIFVFLNTIDFSKIS